jgi:predicted DNA-binding transcriptional regulator AlpA
MHLYEKGIVFMICDEDTVDVKDLMRTCKVTRRTVYKWIEEEPNFPKPFKIGLKLFWKRSEIDSYIESTRKGRK